jgi:hypothetical protein
MRAADSQKLTAGKILRGESPLNLEMPFETLEGFLTPTESFYVRTHFPIPSIDKDAWWLRIEGEVENSFANQKPKECNGDLARSAQRSGLECHCQSCLIAPTRKQTAVTWFWKERMAACSKIRRVRLAS